MSKPERIAELFPDEDLRSKVKHIYVFPNIELRLDTFVGVDNHSVNYHVFFSGETDCSIIEERFLQRLSILHRSGSQLPVNRSSICQLGREYKLNNPSETRDDYFVGLEKATVHHDDVFKVLRESANLLDKYFLSIPVDEDLSELRWDGRYSETRRTLYHQCHFLMSSNAGTRKFALAEGHEEDQIREFGSIKPCIWGSDAHDYSRLFTPDQDRYCWIKAEPTFEGLQQVLYEPADRVRIQKEKPEEKDQHQLIDYIVFHDDRFEENPIYFSEGLTAIIGGKSTGKSILLRHIAKCIDPKQVQDKETRSLLNTSTKLEASAEVFWRDGVSGERKIIYIPQSWLNRVVDESGGDTELNAMIRGILLQQPQIKFAHDALVGRVTDVLDTTKRGIGNYIFHLERANECEKQLSEHGRSAAFYSSIQILEKNREELSAEVGITDDMLDKYNDLESKIAEQTGLLSVINNEETKISQISEPFVYIPGITSFESNKNCIYELSDIPTISELFDETIKKNTSINEAWASAIKDASSKLAEKKKNIMDDLEKLNSSLEPLRQTVARNDQLKKIDNQLKEERLRLKKAIDIETEKNNHLEELLGSALENRGCRRFLGPITYWFCTHRIKGL